MHTRTLVALLLATITVASCAPAASPSPAAPAQRDGAAATQAPAPAARDDRTLVAMLRVEPTGLSPRPLQRGGGVTTAFLLRLANAGLTILDDRAQPQPYLAEVLPQLNTDSWRVSSDGKMETTYRLHADLVWHDGQPLTADDFVFAWQVYATPELGASASIPFNVIEEVTAPDPRTVLIRWRRPYPDAGILQAADFPPLPRHILESAFQSSASDAFVAHPYWTRDYVAAGPYRVTQWQPGASIDFAAFDRHVLGRPKISTIRLRWNGDPNTVLANLLAGEIQVSADDSIQFTHASILRREWMPSNAGSILFFPTLWRSVQVQLRPELVTPRSLLDLRVRRALAHAVDKQALNEALFEGQGIMSDSMIPPTMPYFADTDRAVAKYPYDLRRTEQLMQEAGYLKGGDGVFTNSTEGRFSAEVKINGGAQYESEMSIMAAGWRQAGFELKEVVNPAALAQDGETRSLFPSLWTASGPLGEDLVRSYSSGSIPRAENRWIGRNRIAWINPEADRLIDAFNTTLDRNQRNQQVVQFVHTFTDELPEISLYFDPSVVAHVAALTGPRLIAPGGTSAWDIHQWELK